jgi:hypothetical protein
MILMGFSHRIVVDANADTGGLWLAGIDYIIRFVDVIGRASEKKGAFGLKTLVICRAIIQEFSGMKEAGV